jgi:hypothetical protein
MSREPFAWFDPDTLCWRTFQPCLDPSFSESPTTWPRSGTTFDGHAYELATSEHRTAESGSSSLLPTPMALGAETRNATAARTNLNSKHHSGMTLADVLVPRM